jgi:excisionase family DNA binding protein
MDTMKTDPAALTPDQALAVLGKVISRASFYNAINRNEVPHLRLGKRILIPRATFLRWIESAGSRPQTIA